jgi:peptidoglycan hydrolase-like protein with peptidoglycan-binding domain
MAKVTYDIVRGFIGADVTRLQTLLNDNSNAGLVIDGVYGAGTFNAVKAFEQQHGLAVTGKCAGSTLRKARDLGFDAVEFEVDATNSGAAFPRRPGPAVLPQPTAAITASMFGTFPFARAPLPGNPENIRILNDWATRNIVTITVPQLVGVPIQLGQGHATLSKGKVNCHMLAKDKILALFKAWGDAGLATRILTWDGGFNARLKRGRTVAIPANLSNHSFGATFDINAGLNPMGNIPVLMGGRGCVRELVGIANDLGFYWGGHFGQPPDGMHFEVAKL